MMMGHTCTAYFDFASFLFFEEEIDKTLGWTQSYQPRLFFFSPEHCVIITDIWTRSYNNITVQIHSGIHANLCQIQPTQYLRSVIKSCSQIFLLWLSLELAFKSIHPPLHIWGCSNIAHKIKWQFVEILVLHRWQLFTPEVFKLFQFDPI